MGNVLELRRVEEPVWIKEMIRNFSKILESEESKSKSRGVLIYNKLPQYIWNAWGKDLKKLGISWQDFLKLLSKNSDAIVDWAVNERMTWDELINTLKEVVLSHGTVAKRESTTLDKFIKREKS